MNFDVLLIITSLLIFGIALVHGTKRKIDPQKTLVYGPALNRDIVLPARYFYIQAVDNKGKNYTSSPGGDTFKVTLSTSHTNRVRAWKKLLDRHDGSFIVFYRLYESIKDLTIEVRYKGEEVASSPYVLKGYTYHEQCNCPESDVNKWLDDMKCRTELPKQILNDLKPYPSINIEKMFQEGVEKYKNNGAVCYYSIVDNQLYKKCYGSIVGFSQFIEAWLLSLTRKVRLPDMEFFFNLGDWPLDKRNSKISSVPIFSWCGSDETNDFVVPTYDLTQSTLETLGRYKSVTFSRKKVLHRTLTSKIRVSLDMLSLQGNTGPKWKQKIEKGFFRGRDSRQERLDLTVMGRSKTDLFDVGLTNFFFFEYDERKYGPKNKHISFFDFFKYKYQLNIDGTVAAYRFPYLLLGNSLVFKQDSQYYEHFYNELSPWKHYVPFKRNLEDLEQQLLWAKANDNQEKGTSQDVDVNNQAKNISSTGQQYARDNLMGDQLYCYTYQLFSEYASRLVGTPQVRNGMEHIKQPGDDDSKCACQKKKIISKEKESKKKKATKKKKKSHEEL